MPAALVLHEPVNDASSGSADATMRFMESYVMTVVAVAADAGVEASAWTHTTFPLASYEADTLGRLDDPSNC